MFFFVTSVGMNLKQMWVHGVKSPEKKDFSAPSKNAPSLVLLLSSTPLTLKKKKKMYPQLSPRDITTFFILLEATPHCQAPETITVNLCSK